MENNLEEKNIHLEEIKKEFKNSLEEKQKLGILETTNVTLLKKLIDKAETIQEAQSIMGLGMIYKRTGLHFDHRLETKEDNIKYLKKNEKLSFITNNNSKTHKLIIGDNYDALLNLLISYKNMIDVIYIDPPYGKDSMGEFAKTNYRNSLTRDNLLSMVEPRLELSKQLLSNDGIIFCSIDDRNYAYVKCLFDEIFGEQNFIANIIWKSGGGKSDSKNIKNKKEYLLVYSKDSNIIQLNKKKSPIENYKLVDKNGNRYCERSFDMQGLKYSKNLDYPIEAPDGSYIYAGKSREAWESRQNGNAEDRDFCWTLSKDEFENRLKNNEIIFKNTKNGWRVYYKSYYDGKETAYDDIFDNISYFDQAGNQIGAIEIKDIFGSRKFDYPKPVEYIKWILNLYKKKNTVVLDFFAGSGTTGQAVLELNRKDGGNRQFILCTNNEESDGFIATNVTTKRLKRVMTGKCYDGTSDFNWINKNEPYGDNLDVFEIETVSNSEYTEGKTAFDVIDETLYGVKKFKNIKEKIKWVCQNFDNTQKQIETDKEWLNRIMEGIDKVC